MYLIIIISKKYKKYNTKICNNNWSQNSPNANIAKNKYNHQNYHYTKVIVLEISLNVKNASNFMIKIMKMNMTINFMSHLNVSIVAKSYRMVRCNSIKSNVDLGLRYACIVIKMCRR